MRILSKGSDHNNQLAKETSMRKKKTVEVLDMKELEKHRPRPISIDEEFTEEAEKEYARLSGAIGLKSVEFTKGQVETSLAKIVPELYALSDISQWMDRIYGKRSSYYSNYAAKVTKYKWGYWPLRKLDRDQKIATRQLSNTPYKEIIPIPVLQTVEAVIGQFPDAGFIVADKASIKITKSLDPFMIVSIQGYKYGIAYWDEPGFGEWKKKKK